MPNAPATMPNLLDPAAFPAAQAAIARSPFNLGSDWLDGTDKEVLARIDGIHWDHQQQGDRVGHQLAQALVRGSATVVAAMLDRGVSVNLQWHMVAKGSGGPVSALRMALETASPEVVRLLLERGAQMMSLEAQARHPAMMALAGGRRRGETDASQLARETAMLALLREHDLLRTTGNRLLLNAVRTGASVDSVQRLLRHGLGQVNGDVANHTPLTHALTNGNPAMVAMLLAEGARPHPDEDHPLITAAHHPRRARDNEALWQQRVLQIAEHLRAHGLTQDLPPDLPLGPRARVPEALGSIRPAVLRPLLRMLAANATPSAWWDALDRVDETEVQRLLSVSNGRCAQWRDTAHRSALNRLLDAVRPIPVKMARLPRKTRSHQTTVQTTERTRRAGPEDAPETSGRWLAACRLTEKLVGLGEDPLHRVTTRVPAVLWQALELPHDGLARAMVDAAAPVQKRDLVLQAVTHNVPTRSLERLIALGAPPDEAFSEALRSPLHLAVKDSQNHHLVAPLLRAGASLTSRNQEGHTVVDLAARLVQEAEKLGHADQIDAFRALMTQLEAEDLRREIDANRAPDRDPTLAVRPRTRL